MDDNNVLLSWSGFQKNQFSSFAALAQAHEFSDVTLVGDDDKPILSHKVVLASGSPYLRSLLLRHHHPHPMLLLPGLGEGVLSHILAFLYLGEVAVPQNRLQQFLRGAQKFKIKGLQNSELNEEPTATKEISYSDKSNADIDQNIFTPDMSVLDRNKKASERNLEEFSFSPEKKSHIKVEEIGNIEKDNHNEKHNLIEEHFDHFQQKFYCLKCDFSTKECDELKYHIKNYHLTSTVEKSTNIEIEHTNDALIEKDMYSCNLCDHKLTTQQGIIFHKQNIHDGIKYNCDKCSYKTPSKENLTRHRKNKRGCKDTHKNRQHTALTA